MATQRLTGVHSAGYLITHGRLLLRVSVAELRARYAGSLLGLGWVVVAPLLILSVYAAIYLLIFKIKVPGLSGVGYTLYIFAGLVPYLMLADALSNAVTSVVANKAVLNNTVFPIDLAPPKAVVLAQPTMAVGMLVTVAGLLASGLGHWTVLIVMPLWLLQAMALTGVGWILSLLNIVFRDLQNLITVLLMLILVISPIAYTPSMVPSQLKPLLEANPFAHFVIAYQQTMVLGILPSATDWVVLCAMSIGVFLVGGWFFARTKRVLIDYV